MALELVIKVRPENYNQTMRQVRSGATSVTPALTQLKGLVGGLFAGFTAVAFVRELKAAQDAAVLFEDSLLRTNTLVGVSQQQIESWRPRLAALSAELGRLPTELSEALFFITSGGLRGDNALDLLAESGKAAAIGLGQTKTIADAAGSALNAYGGEALTAEEAVNVLFETVREGKLAADSLAPSLGKVIGLASEMGVEFGEVGAFLAAYTRLGGSAQEATFSLSSVLTNILSPADSVRERLALMDLSANALRRSIREDGLAATLLSLADAVGEDEDALGELIPEVRALRGFLNVAGKQAETYIGISNRLTDETIELREAWRTLKELSPGQELAEINAQIELQKIAIGKRLIPAYRGLLLAIKEVVFIDRVFADASRIFELLDLLTDEIPIEGAKDYAEFIAASRAHWESIAKTVPEVAVDISRIGSATDFWKRQVEGLTNRLNRAWMRENVLRPIRDLEAELRGPAAAATEQHRQNLLDWSKAAREAGLSAEETARGVNALNAAHARSIADRISDWQDLSTIMSEVASIVAALSREPIEIELISPSRPTTVTPGRLEPASGVAQTVEDTLLGIPQKLGTRIEDELGASITLVSREFRNTFEDRIGELGAFISDNWQAVLATVLQGIVDAINKPRQRGRFGGTLSDDFADEGGAILGAVGGAVGSLYGPVGQVVGTVIGEVIGGVIGGAIKRGADTGLGILRQIGDDVATQITQDEGGLGWVIAEIGAGLSEALSDIESSLRGQINIGAGGIGISVRDDIISVFVNGLTGQFETIQEAIDFAIVQAIKSARPAGGGSTAGASPEVLAALQNFAGQTVEGLNEAIALALRLEEGRVGSESFAVTQRISSIVSDIIGGILAGISPEGGFANLFLLRDQLLGVERDEVALKNAQIDAYNAGIVALKAQLLAQDAEIQAQIAATQARGLGTNLFLESVDAELRAQQLRLNASNQVNAAWIAALNATQAALAQLDGLIITAGERAGAIAGLGRGGGTVGDGGVAQRRQQRASLQARLDTLRDERLGIDAAALAAAQLARDIAAVQEEARGTGFRNLADLIAEMEAAASRAEQERRSAILDPFRDAASGEGETSLARSLREIRERAQQAIADLGQVNDLNGDLNIIRQGEAAMIRELGEGALASLGSRTLAARDSAAQFGETLLFLVANLEETGVGMEDLATAVSDQVHGVLGSALGFLSSQVESLPVAERQEALERIAAFEREQWRLEFEFQRIQIAGLHAQIEAAGLMTESLSALFENVEGLFDLFGGSMDEVLASIGQQAEQIQRDIGSATITGRGDSPFERAGALLDQLAQMQVQATTDPLAAIRLEAQQMADAFFEVRHALNLHGTSLGEVNAELAAITQARLSAEWDRLSSGFRGFLDDLEFGSLSGASSRVQAQFAQARVRSLLSRAQAGDALALQELGTAAPEFFRLASQGLGGADLARIRQELLEQGRLAATSPFGTDGAAQGRDFARIADQLGMVVLSQQETTGAVTLEGERNFDVLRQIRDKLPEPESPPDEIPSL